MTKQQLLIWYIKVYWRFLGKKIIYKIGEGVKTLSSEKYTITENDLVMVGDNLEKLFKVIDSCKYSEHIEVAERCADVFSTRFPFALIISNVVNKKIDKLRPKLRSYYEISESNLN
ncbi:hypothetical protein M0P65_06735 [Candidatus Gracilibacteria bacterium]|jgi:hypothetical protein|nr:hypothetical protein [Candidatus Gracilibacteria bacterium]